jgi:uncharacterized protein
MEIHKEDLPKYAITSYQSGLISIDGQVYSQSFYVSDSKLVCPWGPSTVQELGVNHFEQIDLSEIEVIILGHQLGFLMMPLAIRQYLNQQRIGIETMNIGAASRTFNLLLSEKRKVLAIFLLN